MDARHSKFAIKLLPSMTDFAFLMPILFLFGRMQGTATLLGDGDTGWHIRAGDWILQHHAVPRQDIFSFSKPGEAWYAWEWLSEVIWASLHRVGGLGLVAVFCTLLIALTFALVFRLGLSKANPLVALALTMAAAAVSTIHWLARPHLFTLLFVVVFCGILERHRSGRDRIGKFPLLAVLPVLTVLWSNLHGGFLAGIVILAAYAAGEGIRAAVTADRDERSAAAALARRYAITAAACLGASVINPYGLQLHAHLFNYLQSPFESKYIVEFLPLSFDLPLAGFCEAFLAMAAAAAFWNISKGRYIEPVLIFGLMHAAASARRHLPVMAVAAAPFVAAAVDEWIRAAAASRTAGWLRGALDRFNRVGLEFADTERIGRWHLPSLAGAVIVTALLFSPNPPKPFRPAFDAGRFPQKAVDHVALDPGARIFTFDQWGDYLIYRLYPNSRVFIDGRTDYYGAEFEKNAIAAQNVRHDWESTLDRFGIDTILLSPRTPLTGALKECDRWRLDYDDGIALVFRKVSGQGDAAAAKSGGGRDREITKIKASDRPITRKDRSTT